MKQFTKDLWVSIMSGFAGKVLVIVVPLTVLSVIGWTLIQPKISVDTGGLAELIINKFSLMIFFVLPSAVVFLPRLVSEKMQAGVTKEQNKNETEIKKAELENEKIRLQNEQLALQNRQLELQKENQQSLPKGGE